MNAETKADTHRNSSSNVGTNQPRSVMPEKSRVSKAFAVTFAILTVSVIAGIVTMTLLYKTHLTSTTPPDLRLPGDLLPENYHIFFQPHFHTRLMEEGNATSPNQTSSFTGNSTVHFRCVKATRSIYLHSWDLTLSGQQVMNKDTNEEIGVSSMVEQEDRNGFLKVEVEEDLKEGGNYSLFLDFEGETSSGLNGLYVSKYVEGTPEYEGDMKAQRFLVATNLEPSGARMLFPCFDEPAMKAVFHVTVIHRRNTTALGNAPSAASNILDEDWKYTRFYPTPKMSTYLLAFTVSEFSSTPSSHEHVNIKTYARPEATREGHTKYAADITGRILKYYENLFEIDYEMKELDQIAMPDLYPQGMENWGLITYDERSLLYEEGVSSSLLKEEIVPLIAHELAHMWFGNLVTMKWWNELWLKEGFATYMTILATESAEPTFKLTSFYLMMERQVAFGTDSRTTSHPLSPPAEDIQTDEDIEGMYSQISYSKGAMVLRMLADFMGESVFNKGVRMYLKAFQKESTDRHDLWTYMQKAYGNNAISISKLMDPWVTRKGFPLITINTTTGEIYQKQFLYNDTAENSFWWYIPIRFMSNTSEPSLLQLDVSGPVMKEEFISRGAWILANVNCTGYYRVNYNPENWESLLNQLETDRHRIPLMNRAQIIDDTFSLARAKLVNVTLALNSTRFLRKERALLPWAIAAQNLKYFCLMFDHSEVFGPMQMYLRGQVKDLYNYFRNYTDNSTVPVDLASQHNQINAIEVACSYELPECVEMAKTQYADWMKSNNTNDIHPNLRSEIYCHAVAAGGMEEWEFAWDKYLSSNDTTEKEQLQGALSCTKKTWLLNRYLEYTLDPERIRLRDISYTIYQISVNPAGHALAWNFIREHWDYVSQRDESTLIMGVAERFSSQFELEQLKRFVEEKKLPVSVVEDAIKRTQLNIEWMRENRDAVMEWFTREAAASH